MVLGGIRGLLCLIALGAVSAACEDAAPFVSSVPEDPSFRPERLRFGTVPLSGTSTDTIVVTNPNGGPVFLTSLRIEGEDRANFWVDGTEIEIEGRRTRQVILRFKPMKLGRITADLEIFHSEAQNPAVITLVGTGTVSGPVACVDADNDGYPSACDGATDCNDSSNLVYPGAAELCDGLDNNCNGDKDEGLVALRYLDGDLDTWGTGIATIVSICPEPVGYAERGGDCQDALPAVNPGASEVCDGVDNNCNIMVDEGFVVTQFYLDRDQDLYGDTNSSTTSCAAPAGYVAQSGDCDDTLGTVNPGQVELCDGIDNDCNRLVDEGLSAMTYYQDLDMDGYGDAATATVACGGQPGWVLDNLDCNDNAFFANPAGTEICSGGIDEDCDRLIDDQDPDCQCTTQNDCGPSSNGAVCPRTGAASLQCRTLCRDPGDCLATEGCRPLPGSAGLGFCQPGAGFVPENGTCTLTSQCSTGICFGGACKRVCQSQADCVASDVCGIALYDTAEIGGIARTRQTMLCQPLLARQPIGTGNCLIDSFNADTGQCATTHCDWDPWRAQTAATPVCAPLCAGSDDCGPSQVCGIIANSSIENPPIPGTQEGAGRFHDAILGCYTPHIQGTVYVPPGFGALGAPCTGATARTSCRSHQCAQFAPIANRCTDFCDDDADCLSPGTPNWRCLVAEINFASLYLQGIGVGDATKFALVGICAP